MKAKLNIDVDVTSHDPDVGYKLFRDFPVEVLGWSVSGRPLVRGQGYRYRRGYQPYKYDGITTFVEPHHIRLDVPRLPAPEYFEPREGVRVRV